MKVLDFLYLTSQSFKNRKSRIVLTVLGVSVGIGATLFLVSLGYGLQHALFERIVTEESLLTLDITSADPEIIRLDQPTLKTIAQLPYVERVSPQAVFSAQVFYNQLTTETHVNIINADFFTLGGIVPDLGRAFVEDDRQKIVINSSFAELFALESEQSLGEKFGFLIFVPKQTEEEMADLETFEPKEKFEIVGVIHELDVPPQVYLHKKDIAEMTIFEYQFAKVMATNNQYIEEVSEKLIGMGFMASALIDVIEQATQVFQVIQIVLGIFGIVALFVAAIGLVNTMTISLLQRTSDIGIMRAIGASPQDIKRMFLVESLTIGFFGGIAGIFVGIFAGETFNFGLNILARMLGGQPVDIFYYPLWFITFVVILSSLVGLIAGFWPAKRAAELNPLEALRYK